MKDIISLFSGALGLDLGLEKAGFGQEMDSVT
jgi:site-specific DNA-cytosine methylase